MLGFVIRLVLLVGMGVAFVVGITSGATELVLPWLCLSVPVALIVGRMSVKVIPPRKVMLVSDSEYTKLQTLRGKPVISKPVVTTPAARAQQ